MKAFKICPNCGHLWVERDAFINDPEVSIVGYQVHFEDLKAGFFLFNHSCNTTFALKVEDFQDLYAGPVFEERKTGSDECPGFCLKEHSLEPCKAKCECAFVREIIQIFNSSGT